MNITYCQNACNQSTPASCPIAADSCAVGCGDTAGCACGSGCPCNADAAGFVSTCPCSAETARLASDCACATDNGFVPVCRRETACCSRPCMTRRCTGTAEDFGPNPYVFDLIGATRENQYFRRVIWTGTQLQLTMMCIPPYSEIGLEQHAELDQMLFVVQGVGKAMMGSGSNSLSYAQNIAPSSAILIPAGTWHNVVNTGATPLKLFSVYAPVQHPAGLFQCTKADADAAE